MRKIVLAAGIAMLVVAGCSKPTELASEANAKYDRRDPVIAPPAVGAEVDTTPVEPLPGSPEAEALPGEADLAPAEGTPVDATEGVTTETVDPAAPPAETLAPPVETPPPVTETPPATPPATEPGAPAAPVSPPAETPPAPGPN